MLVVLLGHFLFGLQEDGTIPCLMVCISRETYNTEVCLGLGPCLSFDLNNCLLGGGNC
jgi:hypothetical protein